jgi:hypothetical protein
MAVLATDSFDRADGIDLGADWDVVLDHQRWVITSNRVEPQDLALGKDASEMNVSTAWPADHFSRATIAAIAGTGSDTGVGVAVRCVTNGIDTASMYRVVANLAGTNNTSLDRYVANVYSTLLQGTAAWTVGDRIELQVQGLTLVVLRNGAVVFSTTDSALSTGRPGISHSAVVASASVDNWEGGDLADVTLSQSSGLVATPSGVS